MLSAGLNLQPHTGVLPVTKGLRLLFFKDIDSLDFSFLLFRSTKLHTDHEWYANTYYYIDNSRNKNMNSSTTLVFQQF